MSSATPLAYRRLEPGDPAPIFSQRSVSNPKYAFDTAAGRYLVLCFFGSAGDDLGAGAIAAASARPDLFDDQHASFFGVSCDGADQAQGRLQERVPGFRYFLDFDAKVSRLYGAVPRDQDAGQVRLRRLWVVTDPTLRVIAVVPFEREADHAAVIDLVAGLPPPDRFLGEPITPPVLQLPGVFDADICARLIAAYDTAGGELSGFMREEGGKTVLRHDPGHKRRRDHMLTDTALIRQAHALIERRIVPEILKVHQFKATRIERNLVGCYTAEDGGHFRPHRDNTTKGTAHRRFAVSINLNDDFEGGRIGFPEYGNATFKPRPGGAVVFSCSLLHTVTPVTKGQRYAFLPFLYDEAAAEVREQNKAFLDI